LGKAPFPIYQKMKTQNITESEAVALFKAGQPVVLVEYRFGKCETINWRDKTTKQAASFTQVRHTVELADGSFTVAERVPDNFDASTWTQTIAKSTKCLLKFNRFIIEKGVGQFSGELFVIQLDKR